MLELNAAAFYGASTRLAEMASYINAQKDVEKSIFRSDKTLDQLDRRFVVPKLENLGEHLRSLGAQVTLLAVEEAVEYVNSGHARWGRVQGRVEEINNTLERELTLISLVALSQDDRAWFSPKEPLFGPEVEAKFTDMSEDIAEAGKCLALGRPTAAVFHLMRVMEIGVQRFGTELGVTLASEKNWQNILDQINKSVKALNHKDAKTKAFAEAASHLYNVKVAWRNEVMHPKQTYTIDQARTIFNNARAFIGDLAALL